MAAPCSLDGCERAAWARGYCSPHYMRLRMGNDLMEPIRKRNRFRAPCSVDGCGQPSKAKGLCQSHYDKQRKKKG